MDCSELDKKGEVSERIAVALERIAECLIARDARRYTRAKYFSGVPVPSEVVNVDGGVRDERWVLGMIDKYDGSVPHSVLLKRCKREAEWLRCLVLKMVRAKEIVSRKELTTGGRPGTFYSRALVGGKVSTVPSVGGGDLGLVNGGFGGAAVAANGESAVDHVVESGGC